MKELVKERQGMLQEGGLDSEKQIFLNHMKPLEPRDGEPRLPNKNY